VATDTSTHNVTENDLIAADVRTTDTDVNLLEHIDDRDMFEKVRGTNPNTGASSGLILKVANDPGLSKLALALRQMPTGSFQAINGDLRSVEASCAAAVALVNMFGEQELGFKHLPKKDDNDNDDTPVATSGRSSKN
jgi:hypothetical protein